MDKGKGNRSDLIAAGKKKFQQFRQKKDSKGNTSSSQRKTSQKARKSEELVAPDASASVAGGDDVVSAELDVVDTVPPVPVVEDVDPDVGSTDLSALTISEGERAAGRGVGDGEVGQRHLEGEVVERGVAEGSDLDSSICKDEEGRAASSGVESPSEGVGMEEVIVPDGPDSSAPREEANAALEENKTQREKADAPQGEASEFREETGSSRSLPQEVDRSGSVQLDFIKETDGIAVNDKKVVGERDEAVQLALNSGDEEEAKRFSIPVETNDSTSHPIQDQPEVSIVGSDDIVLPYSSEQVEASGRDVDQNKEISLVASDNSVPYIDARSTDNFVSESFQGMEEGNDIDRDYLTLSGKEEERQGQVVSSEKSVCSYDLYASECNRHFEILKQQLYEANVAKECLQVQLAENVDSQAVIDQSSELLHTEISKLQSLIKGTQEINESLNGELAHCRSELNTLSLEKEEFKLQFLSAKDDVKELKTQFLELQDKLKESEDKVAYLVTANNELQISHDSGKAEAEEIRARASHLNFKSEKLELEAAGLSGELSECRGLLNDLQKENANLTERYALAVADIEKLEEEKEYFAGESTKVATDLLEHKERVLNAFNAQAHLATQLKEALTWIDSLSEENIYLSTLLEVHQVNLKELDARYSELFSSQRSADFQVQTSDLLGEVGFKLGNESPKSSIMDNINQFSGPTTEYTETGGVLGSSYDQHFESFGKHASFNSHLEQGRKILENLEKVVQSMQSHSDITHKAMSKVSASGVSKLIQAFESKVQHDESGTEGLLTEERFRDSLKSARELMLSLRNVFEQFSLNIFEAKKIIDDTSKSENGMTAALRDLETKCESKFVQTNQFVSRIGNLVNDMMKYPDKLDTLQIQFEDLHVSCSYLTDSLFSQTESLENIISDTVYLLDQDRRYLVSSIFRRIESLHASTKFLISPIPPGDLSAIVGSSASVDDAVKMIESLCAAVEAAHADSERINLLYRELDQRLMEADGRNKKTVELLDGICNNLENLVRDFSQQDAEEMANESGKEKLVEFEPKFEILINQLRVFLCEKQHLDSVRKELESELLNRNDELLMMKQKCSLLSEKLHRNETKKCDVEPIEKVINIIQAEVQIEKEMVREDQSPISQLENLIAFLLQKYKEATKQISMCVSYLKEVSAASDVSSDYWLGPLHLILKQECDFNLIKLNELQEEVYRLSAIALVKEDEAFVLKETIAKVEESLEVARSNLLAKAAEVEQAEQKVSSFREKLSLAVAKGKGLIVQRDSLKQSLSEKATELDKMSQDTHLKDEKLLETENKLKIYSEAGERIEALESELSYIRNSATALRESFLLKDSILQKIEEVLEDLEFSENFHSKDIIEKIEWLARSASGTSLPLTEWNNHNSVEESFSNTGRVVMNAWTEDSQVASEQVGLKNLRDKYEELERRFYGLAEHNEMLEQSLLERNSLLQRWEETLNKIDMPGDLRSMEPENQIEWLGKTLHDAHCERDHWHLKVDELESSSGLLISEVDESKRKFYDLSEKLITVTHEKDVLSGKLDELALMHEALLKKMTQFELDKESMLAEIVLLQDKLSLNSSNHHIMVNEVTELSRMITETLPDSEKENNFILSSPVDDLRLLLSTLINRYRALFNEREKDKIEDHAIQNPEDIVAEKEVEVDSVEVEREKYSLRAELDEALKKLTLITEEQSVVLDKYQSIVAESATMRKRNDELQELLSQEQEKAASGRERLNIAVRKGKGLVQQRDHLKQSIEEISAEMDRLKHELDQKNNDLLTFSSKAVGMESDNSFLRNSLRQTELEAEKLKKASELLLAELNEVNERADDLQEELEKVKGDVHELSSEKERLEAEKIDMVSNLDQFRKHQSSYLLEIKTLVEHLRNECFDLSDLVANSFLKDGGILDNVEKSLEAFWKQVMGSAKFPFSAAFTSQKKDALSAISSLLELKVKDENGGTDMYRLMVNTIRQCSTSIDQLKEVCLKHSTSVDQWTTGLPDTVKCLLSELAMQRESFESAEKNIIHLKLLKEDKDFGMSLLYRNLALLYETCSWSFWRLENQNINDSNVTFKPLPSIDELGSTSGSSFSSLEELVRLTADSLLSVVNDRQTELSQKDLKKTIMDLQKEIQDKDFKTKKISEEFVTQIKEAEAAATKYLEELKSAKSHIEGMEEELEVMRGEKDSLEEKLNQNHQATKKELEDKIASLTDVIAAKDQEIDALMQALDEEETQMETLTGKIDELEKTIEEKNLALECLDATRGKTMSKLSTTISRFNELHGLSEGLISEVENLQKQLEGKEKEVSFLRQEVTKCTNDVLTLQVSNKKYSADVLTFLTWLKSRCIDFGIQNIQSDKKDDSLMHDYMDIFGKAITSVLSELNSMRSMAQSMDTLLQTERNRVGELVHEGEALKLSIREKESRLQMLLGTQNSGQSSHIGSMEALEPDQVSKRSVALGSINQQVPSMRKVNNDQVALSIDLESGETMLEDEDDDKAHGFKPLVMSNIVPRFSRPVAEKVDGLWVSGERMLMRQPTLRLGVVMYWILLHALLATTIV